MYSSEFTVRFLFRERISTAIVYIDDSEHPCYLFIILNDKALIAEFDEEIAIKTDGNNILPMKHSYPTLDALRIALFIAIKIPNNSWIQRKS